MSQETFKLSKPIGGFKYRVFMLDPLEAGDILADLGYLLAPVLGPLGSMMASVKGDLIKGIMDGFKDGEGPEGETLGQALDKAALGFFDRVTKEKQRELMAAMAKMTMVVIQEGKEEPELSTIFTTHFRGRVKNMYEWFFFAMRTQFDDFFTGLGTGMSQSRAQRMTESKAKS